MSSRKKIPYRTRRAKPCYNKGHIPTQPLPAQPLPTVPCSTAPFAPPSTVPIQQATLVSPLPPLIQRQTTIPPQQPPQDGTPVTTHLSSQSPVPRPQPLDPTYIVSLPEA